VRVVQHPFPPHDRAIARVPSLDWGNILSEFSAVDSDGNQQFIWLQERDQSCGPACVYMIERIVRQQSIVGGEERVRAVSAALPGGYNEASGTNSTALAMELQKLGIPASHSFQNDMKKFVSSAKFPFIAHVAWAGGGGHFVVGAASGASKTLICLDPWYGLSEQALSTLPKYSVSSDAKGGVSKATPTLGTLSGFVITI
jgi:hypothetical protein